MKVRDYINQIIPALKLEDPLDDALIWMEENKVAELPVIDENSELVGLITETFLLEHADLSKTVKESKLPDHNRPNGLDANKHIFEAFSYLGNNQLTIIPVLDASQKYLGCISIHDLVQVFSEISSFKEVGGIIVLGVKALNYQLSDIVRIVEMNGAKVLSTFVMTEENNLDDIKVVVKINQTLLNGIIASFERYEYQVLERYSSEKEVDPNYDNLGNFFKYLDL